MGTFRLKSDVMDSVFIINGDEMHPHSLSTCSVEIKQSYLCLTCKLTEPIRSIVNIIHEDIYGLTDYVFVIDGVHYNISSSEYIVYNIGNELFERIKFNLRGNV